MSGREPILFLSGESGPYLGLPFGLLLRGPSPGLLFRSTPGFLRRFASRQFFGGESCLLLGVAPGCFLSRESGLLLGFASGLLLRGLQPSFFFGGDSGPFLGFTLLLLFCRLKSGSLLSG